VVDVPSGLFAVTLHLGPYDGLGNTWDGLISDWFPASGYEIGKGPSFEVYLDDCRVVPVEQVRTEVCMPIKKPAA